MHGEVDLAGQQRLLDLLGEQPLAAGLGERPVLDAVAGGLDDAHLELVPAGAVRRLQALAHLARLGQRQRRAARADADFHASQAFILRMLGGCRALAMLPAIRDATPHGRTGVIAAIRPGCKHSALRANAWTASAIGSTRETLVLGIETSCDETAAAVVARAADGRGRILSNVVRAQWEQHRRYGGVVPEIAARAHVECLDEIIAQAMREAGVDFADLDAVAVTAGPGLIGGLLVGRDDAPRRSRWRTACRWSRSTTSRRMR